MTKKPNKDEKSTGNPVEGLAPDALHISSHLRDMGVDPQWPSMPTIPVLDQLRNKTSPDKAA
jgi:hypothetical protein